MVKVSKKKFRKFVEKVAQAVEKIDKEYKEQSKKRFPEISPELRKYIKGSKVKWGYLPDKKNDPFLGKYLRYSLLERMRRKNLLLRESYRILKAQAITLD